jgi:CheY-like chemotaxis protein
MDRARILYVENEPEHQNSFGGELRRSGYQVEIAKGEQEAIELLGRAGYDLLLENMHLTEFRDHGGERVLAFALHRYPHMPRVVVSGDKPESAFMGSRKLNFLKGYFERYRLAETFEKGPDTDLKLFSKRIDEIIAQKGSAVELGFRREVGGRPYEIRQGANRDILSFLMRCNVLDSIFEDVPNYQDYLFVLLSGEQSDERYVAAHYLWKGLWLQEKGLPYFDMIGLLTERELDGTLYRGYRDHVVHSLNVYLLGLYIYYGSVRIRESLEAAFQAKTDFMLAWKIAALYHDIGYVWAIDPSHQPKVEEYFFKKLQAYMDYPLYLYCQARGLKLTEREERDLRLKAQAYVREVKEIRDLRRTISNEYPLDSLDSLVRGVNLVPVGEQGILGRYDYFAKVTNPRGFDYPVQDHGILSALTLICQYEYFLRYTEKVCPIALSEATLSQQTRDALNMLHAQAARCADHVRQAAAAIALHNVSVRRHSIDDAKDRPHRLTLDAYQLSLDRSPLALLLALADVLQCWDRPMRTHVPEALRDCAWQSQDVRILIRDDTLSLCFLKDPRHRRCTSDSVVTTLLAEMREYISPVDLEVVDEIAEPWDDWD